MPEQTISQSQLQSLQGEHTAEPLSIPIDYEAVDSIDPPVGKVFSRQADWDDYLASQGATAYKHVNEVVQALPYELRHTVTLNLAPGTHFVSEPSPVTGFAAAFLIEKWATGDGGIRLHGAGKDDYTVIVGPLTITGNQAASSDPYLDFADTPFSGMVLKGKMVRLSTGQLAMIHDHTDSRLNLIQPLSPAVVNGITTAVVVKPSTVLRNAKASAPTTKATSLCLSVSLKNGAPPGYWPVEATDLTLEAMGGTAVYVVGTGSFFCKVENVVIDHEDQRVRLVVTPNGRDIQVGAEVAVHVKNFSAYADPANMGSRDEPIYVGQVGAAYRGINLENSYFGNSTKSLIVFTGVMVFQGGVVLDNVGSASAPAIDMFTGARFAPEEFYTGKPNTIRDCEIGLDWGDMGMSWRAGYLKLVFESITDACIVLGIGAVVDAAGASSFGFVDGGSNTGVGIRLTGPGALIKIPVGTDVEGTGGAIELGDGTLKTYAELDSPGVLSDAYHNVIARG